MEEVERRLRPLPVDLPGEPLGCASSDRHRNIGRWHGRRMLRRESDEALHADRSRRHTDPAIF
jgi:hypothetical protein